MVTRLSLTWINQLASFDFQQPSLEAYSCIALEGNLKQDPNLNGLNCPLKVTQLQMETSL